MDREGNSSSVSESHTSVSLHYARDAPALATLLTVVPVLASLENSAPSPNKNSSVIPLPLDPFTSELPMPAADDHSTFRPTDFPPSPSREGFPSSSSPNRLTTHPRTSRKKSNKKSTKQSSSSSSNTSASSFDQLDLASKTVTSPPSLIKPSTSPALLSLQPFSSPLSLTTTPSPSSPRLLSTGKPILSPTASTDPSSIPTESIRRVVNTSSNPHALYQTRKPTSPFITPHHSPLFSFSSKIMQVPPPLMLRQHPLPRSLPLNPKVSPSLVTATTPRLPSPLNHRNTSV